MYCKKSETTKDLGTNSAKIALDSRSSRISLHFHFLEFIEWAVYCIDLNTPLVALDTLSRLHA